MRPILLYHSDVWCVNVSANVPIDKLLFYYIRCVLHVKPITSNGIVVGGWGGVGGGWGVLGLGWGLGVGVGVWVGVGGWGWGWGWGGGGWGA